MDIRKVEKAAREQGWTVEPTKSGHRRFISPKGERTIASGTPGDLNAVKIHVARMKRTGEFTWPWTARQRRQRGKEG